MPTKADSWAFKDVLSTVMVDMNAGCWLWEGGQFPDGYGCVRLGGKVRGAHRASYERHYGEIPSRMHVLHKCDVRACINPDHLFLGTNQDNVADRAKKGRTNRTFLRSVARKLTDEQVMAVFTSQGCTEQIAKTMGVDDSTVIRIKNGRTWSHLTGKIYAKRH